MESTADPEVVALLEVAEEQTQVISRLFCEHAATGHFNRHFPFYLFTCVYARAEYIF